MEHEPNREYSHMGELVIMEPGTKEKQTYYQAHKASGTAAEFIMSPDGQINR